MKIDRTKIPYAPEPIEAEIDDIPRLALEDKDKVSDLVKQGKREALQELINQRMSPYEQKYADRQAGLPTRDYLNVLLGHSILDKNNDLRGIATTGSLEEVDKKAQAFKSKYYPNLDQALTEHGLSNKMRYDESQSNHYSKKDGLNLSPDTFNDAKMIGTLGHELGHAQDRVRERHAFGEKTPQRMEAVKKLVDSNGLIKEKDFEREHVHSTTRSEGGYSNNPIPNFADYNWKDGDFDSNYMQSPFEIQDKAAKEHHINRNYPFDNLFNVINDDKLVQNESAPDPRKEALKKIIG